MKIGDRLAVIGLHLLCTVGAESVCSVEPSCGCQGGSKACGTWFGGIRKWCYVHKDCEQAETGFMGKYQYCSEGECQVQQQEEAINFVPACTSCHFGDYAAFASWNGSEAVACCMKAGPITCEVYDDNGKWISASASSHLNSTQRVEKCKCSQSGIGNCQEEADLETKPSTSVQIESPEQYDCGIVYLKSNSSCLDAKSQCFSNSELGVLINATYSGGDFGSFQCSNCSSGLLVGEPVPHPQDFTWFQFGMVGVGGICFASVIAFQCLYKNRGLNGLRETLRRSIHSRADSSCMKDHDIYALICCGGAFRSVKVVQSLILSLSLTIIFQAARIATLFRMSCSYTTEYICTSSRCTTRTSNKLTTQFAVEFSFPSLVLDSAVVVSWQSLYELMRFLTILLVSSSESMLDDYILFIIDVVLTAVAGVTAYVSINDISEITDRDVNEYFDKYLAVFAMVVLLKWFILQPIFYCIKLCMRSAEPSKLAVSQSPA